MRVALKLRSLRFHPSRLCRCERERDRERQRQTETERVRTRVSERDFSLFDAAPMNLVTLAPLSLHGSALRALHRVSQAEWGRPHPRLVPMTSDVEVNAIGSVDLALSARLLVGLPQKSSVC